jgi:hypothetical protein
MGTTQIAQTRLSVMAGLDSAIHVFVFMPLKKDVDAWHIGERSDAVLRTAMAGHDEIEAGTI